MIFLRGKPHSTYSSKLSTDTERLDVDNPDVDVLIRELVRSKYELEMAQRQFDSAIDPALIDHVVFRLGAAERQLRYLLNYARKHQLATDGAHPSWTEEI